MKKLITLAAGAVGVTAVSMVMFATGVAAADDYAGQTYADATKALSDAKLKGVIASRFGDALPDDQCVVTHSEKASWIKGDKFAAVTDTVLLHLNCNATVASATTPGNSAASPEGRAALQKANAAAAQDQSSAAANQNQPKH
jgi:beta-lactam-binding protein with PASTA domain